MLRRGFRPHHKDRGNRANLRQFRKPSPSCEHQFYQRRVGSERRSYLPNEWRNQLLEEFCLTFFKITFWGVRELTQSSVESLCLLNARALWESLVRSDPYGPWESGSVREGQGSVPWAVSSPLPCSQDQPGSMWNTQSLPLAAGVLQACHPRGHSGNARALRTSLLADTRKPPGAPWGSHGEREFCCISHVSFPGFGC